MRYAYADANQGQLAAVTDPAGDVFRFTYDAAGRRRGTLVTPNTWSVPSFVDSVSYNTLGQMVSRGEYKTARPRMSRRSGTSSRNGER